MPDLLDLRRAVSRLEREFREAVSHPDLSPGRYALLEVLHRDGDCPLRHLQEATGIDSSTTSQMVEALRNRKLVRTQSGMPPDRRVVTVSLSGYGRKVIIQSIKEWREAQSRVTKGLYTARTGEALNTAIRRIANIDKGTQPCCTQSE